MKRFNILLIVLCLSLGLNAYLLLNVDSSPAQASLLGNTNNERNKITEANEYTDEKALSTQMQGDGNSTNINNTWDLSRNASEAQSTQQGKPSAADTSLQSNTLERNKEAHWQSLLALQSALAFDDLREPLTAYLNRYPDDSRAWLMEAQWILHRQSLPAALSYYYALLNKGLSPEQNTEVLAIIEQYTSNTIQSLTADYAWDTLATFLEPLLQLDPLNRAYIMGLARAYGMLDQNTLMENTLAALPFDDPRATRLRERIAFIKKQSEAQQNAVQLQAEQAPSSVEAEAFEVVEVRTQGQQIFATSSLAGEAAELLVDTGASTSAVASSILDNISDADKSFLGYFSVNTAGGTISAGLYKVAWMQLGNVRLHDVNVMAIPDDNLGQIQGLLGMNVLQGFDIQFNQSSQRMLLTKK